MAVQYIQPATVIEDLENVRIYIHRHSQKFTYRTRKHFKKLSFISAIPKVYGEIKQNLPL